MKHCIKCEFHHRAAVPMQGGQMGMVDMCAHHECSNPVDGSALPCGAARQSVEFCTMKARYFKEKQPDQPKPEGKVIQLA